MAESQPDNKCDDCGREHKVHPYGTIIVAVAYQIVWRSTMQGMIGDTPVPRKPEDEWMYEDTMINRMDFVVAGYNHFLSSPKMLLQYGGEFDEMIVEAAEIENENWKKRTQ